MKTLKIGDKVRGKYSYDSPTGKITSIRGYWATVWFGYASQQVRLEELVPDPYGRVNACEDE